MKRKTVLIILGAAIVLAGIFCFREALAVRLFPKLVLTGAIGEAIDEMEARFEHSPAALIAKALDPEGCQQVTMKLDTATEFMGIAHYDLTLQTQTGPNRITAQGTVSSGVGIMDLELYVDDGFAALASESLTEGAWYGITYESFPGDIRSFQLLGLVLGDDVLKEWDQNVSKLADLMGRDYSIPKLSSQELRTVLQGAVALKPSVEAQQGKHCYRVSFTARGPELARIAQSYENRMPEKLISLMRDMEADPESEMKLVFRLEKRKLTGLDVSLKLSEDSFDGKLLWKDNQLSLALVQWDGENLKQTELSVESVSDGNIYQEKLEAVVTLNGVQSHFSADCSWDLPSGDMSLEIGRDGKRYPIRLNLKGEGDTVSVSCQEFEQVLSLLTGKEKNRNAICTMTVSPGAAVEPLNAYKNLSEWSIEDIYLLLTRLGSLAGIKLP